MGIPVLNDLDTVVWNSSKEYLLEIEAREFPVIAGKILEKGSKPNLASFQHSVTSDVLAVKPLVSGGAKNTLKIVSIRPTESCP